MTQEEKSLLIKDLCGRLPYGVMIQYHTDYDWKPVEMYEISCDTFNGTYSLELCKPYLRPMDDMTEEERHEYNTIAMHTIVTSKGFVHIEATDLIDWLNARHFDYRALIERGLALEAPEGMYNIKEQ